MARTRVAPANFHFWDWSAAWLQPPPDCQSFVSQQYMLYLPIPRTPRGGEVGLYSGRFGYGNTLLI